MELKTILGILAGTLATGCLLPQIIKTYKTKSTKDFSYIYLIALMCGVLLWSAYGFLVNGAAIVIANIVSFFLVSYILFVKLKYKDA